MAIYSVLYVGLLNEQPFLDGSVPIITKRRKQDATTAKIAKQNRFRNTVKAIKGNYSTIIIQRKLKISKELGTVSHACNPIYSRGRNWKD
jgi:hypothetical protein